ncbi:DUF2231 domain-containing protein [Methylomicrobium sp. RS1]|uniref:DUF2231 domain-containing protein n=1 Tax=Candidatus Methylomicrobium oryzae TaxID=2802053 RepID=UPI001F46DCA8|nr:DUF2231 domain-containing protein [Methylomicrobium sp. RS1]
MTLFHSLTFMVHGGADHGGGIAAAVAGLLNFLEKLAGMEPPEIFAAVFPGIESMQNIHPMLVHFPIAFLSAFFLLDLAGSLFRKPVWRAVASWLLYLGALTAIFTAAAGLIAANSVAHGGDVHGIMDRHEHFMLTVLILSLLLSAWRALQGGAIEGAANTLFLILAAVMAGVLVLGADLGGLMVYRYGVAVSAVPVTEEALMHSHSGEEAAHEHDHGPAADLDHDLGHAHESLPASEPAHDDHQHEHGHTHDHPPASK